MNPLQAFLDASAESPFSPRGELACMVCELRGTPPGALVMSRFGSLTAYQAVILESTLMRAIQIP